MKVIFVESLSGDTLLRRPNALHIPSIGDVVYIPGNEKIFKVSDREFHYSDDGCDTILIWLKESL